MESDTHKAGGRLRTASINGHSERIYRKKGDDLTKKKEEEDEEIVRVVLYLLGEGEKPMEKVELTLRRFERERMNGIDLEKGGRWSTAAVAAGLILFSVLTSLEERRRRRRRRSKKKKEV